MNYKEIAIGTTMVAVANIIAFYIFSLYGLGFGDLFDFNKLLSLLTVAGIALAVVFGLLISVALFAVAFFCQRLERNDMLVIAGAGGGISAVVGMFFYSNKELFLFLMLFYILGLLWLAFSRPMAPKPVMKKLGFGWDMPKKVTYALAAGFFFAGLLFTSLNLPYYKDRVMDSMVNMTGGMNPQKLLGGVDLGSAISRDDVRSMMLQWQFTRDEIKVQVTAQYASTAFFNAMTAEQQTALIENATDQVYNAQTANFEQTVDSAYISLQARLENISSGSQQLLPPETMKRMMTQIIDQMPFIGLLFQMLPALMGIIMASTWLLLESLLIAPFTALLALALPGAEETGEIGDLKRRLAEKEKEIAALKNKA